MKRLSKYYEKINKETRFIILIGLWIDIKCAHTILVLYKRFD